MEGFILFKDELPFNHEPSLNYWAHLLARDEMENGAKDYDYEYEQAWHYLEALCGEAA
jgi:hypothetical protein